jgi:hypothetical protein
VIITIRYSDGCGLKPYYLTVAKKLKASHPDVLIEKRILPNVNDVGDMTFEILVDGKAVLGKSRKLRKREGSDVLLLYMEMTRRLQVFVWRCFGEKRRKSPHVKILKVGMIRMGMG